MLAVSFLICFRDWFSNFPSKIFLSLDTSVLYYPVHYWVHDHILHGKLPLLCDFSMHGAPVAAVSMAGVLSPFLWLLHCIPFYTLFFNAFFLLPHLLYLVGAYVLGRRLGLSVPASLLLAMLWTYNGHQMAQLDHMNIAWAHAFFPWTFTALLEYLRTQRVLWLLISSLSLGLSVLSGHPQVVFLECLFFLFWALFSDTRQWRRRLTAMALMDLGGLLVASPLILWTAECLNGNSHLQWRDIDRFYHSWTPLNPITLVFPWFFGRDTFDRMGSDYWWQYQFVEMQVSFSIVGLFFILLFLTQRSPQRRWIAVTAAFGLVMALGRFSFIYRFVQTLPVLSWFRDPSRYWFLVTWAVGLGAAYAWDGWFQGRSERSKGLKLALEIFVVCALFVLVGQSLLIVGRPLFDTVGSWIIRHLLLGDSVHTQSLSAYLDRLPEKWDALAGNLDPRRPRVFLPILFAALLTIVIRNKGRWNSALTKGLLLALVLADLMTFRMPLGAVFYDPAKLPEPGYPPPQNRSLVLLTKEISPVPSQYGDFAYPNWNIVSKRPNLVFDANPMMAGYADLYARLGWFSWVYKDRNPLGFVKDPWAMKALGIDQIVSDVRLKLPPPFRTLQDHYPFLYHLDGVEPPAAVWYELPYEPVKHLKRKSVVLPTILKWDETRLLVTANDLHDHPYLYLQKTSLPGWKFWVNGNPVRSTFNSYGVLMTVPLKKGECQMNAQFDPNSLRLGFFLFFLFSGSFFFGVLRRLSA